MTPSTHGQWLYETALEAQNATCLRSQCGSIIVADNVVIGRGHNTPPGEHETQRGCSHDKTTYDPKVTDKTCCMHAKQRAIMDALRHHPEKLADATLYFVRLTAHGNPASSGQPYCTLCSKMALDVGIAHFVLLHEDGPMAYDTLAYNTYSYHYLNPHKMDTTQNPTKVGF